MRKILFGVLGCLVAVCAHAAQIVNVDYVHKLIAQKWDVSVPIKADSPMQVANMKYLLTAVDVANEILNGEKTTDYGNSEFATLQVADTVATIQAVDTLIQKPIEYKFFITVDMEKVNEGCMDWGQEEHAISKFGLDFSAAGTFYVDWGDGTSEIIKKTDTETISYFHDYGSKNGVYTVKIGGKATNYGDMSVFQFNGLYDWCSSIWDGIVQIDGSLGAIFSTLSDGTQPIFSYVFSDSHNLEGTIPENIFDGIHGDLRDGMFSFAFADTPLTGPSARINGKYLYEIWPDATCNQVGGMYQSATGLDDWDNIPDVWKNFYEACN